MDAVDLYAKLIKWFPRSDHVAAVERALASLFDLKEEIHFELIIY